MGIQQGNHAEHCVQDGIQHLRHLQGRHQAQAGPVDSLEFLPSQALGFEQARIGNGNGSLIGEQA